MQLIGLQLQAARHMRETVDALLLLARSTIQPLEFEVVDISGLARVVALDLPLQERRAPVDWDIEEGLVACASPAALRIVLANLLGNAAKFTREVAEPRIAVSGAVDPDGRLRVRVQDNGAGFDMGLVERLFKPFGRLHSSKDYQGTGIGLTIVQRIVERHGGVVRAQGAVGQGACFEFTLAPAEAADAGPFRT
jgi:signal transduction histidine kinase